MDCVKINPVNLSTTSTPDWEYAGMSCDFVVNASSSPAYKVYDDFTYGDITISLFLFLIFMLGIFSVFWFGIIKPQIHKIHKK